MERSTTLFSRNRDSRNGSRRLLVLAAWSVGFSAPLIGWDLSTVDRQGHSLPDPPLGSLFGRFLILAVALGIGAFATMRAGDDPRSHLLVGTLSPIAWFMWRAQDARVTGDNFALVGVVIMLPLFFGATWVGVQQASLRLKRRDGASAALIPAKRKTNGLGVASLVLGAFTIGSAGSLLALVLGGVALRQIDRSNGTQDGREAAHGGMLIGLLGSIILGISAFV